ncbi:ERMES complex subunit, partial [Coelomomyces lativittatus]
VAASTPLIVPLQLKISQFQWNGLCSLVIDKVKGVTLAFKNDPLINVDVSSSFDQMASVREFLQSSIETLIRHFVLEDIPRLLHSASLSYCQGQHPGHPFLKSTSASFLSAHKTELASTSVQPSFLPSSWSPSNHKDSSSSTSLSSSSFQHHEKPTANKNSLNALSVPIRPFSSSSSPSPLLSSSSSSSSFSSPSWKGNEHGPTIPVVEITLEDQQRVCHVFQRLAHQDPLLVPSMSSSTHSLLASSSPSSPPLRDESSSTFNSITPTSQSLPQHVSSTSSSSLISSTSSVLTSSSTPHPSPPSPAEEFPSTLNTPSSSFFNQLSSWFSFFTSSFSSLPSDSSIVSTSSLPLSPSLHSITTPTPATPTPILTPTLAPSSISPPPLHSTSVKGLSTVLEGSIPSSLFLRPITPTKSTSTFSLSSSPTQLITPSLPTTLSPFLPIPSTSSLHSLSGPSSFHSTTTQWTTT